MEEDDNFNKFSSREGVESNALYFNKDLQMFKYIFC